MKKLIILILLISIVLTACTTKAPPPPTMEEMEQILENKYGEEFTVTSQTETQEELSFTGYVAHPNENPEIEFLTWQYTFVDYYSNYFKSEFRTITPDLYQEEMFMYHFENLLKDNQYLYTYGYGPPIHEHYPESVYWYNIFIALNFEEIEGFYEKLAVFLRNGEDLKFLKSQTNLSEYTYEYIHHPSVYISIFYVEGDKLFKQVTGVTSIMTKVHKEPLSVITAEFMKDRFYESEINASYSFKDEEKKLIIEMLKGYAGILEQYELED